MGRPTTLSPHARVWPPLMVESLSSKSGPMRHDTPCGPSDASEICVVDFCIATWQLGTHIGVHDFVFLFLCDDERQSLRMWGKVQVVPSQTLRCVDEEWAPQWSEQCTSVKCASRCDEETVLMGTYRRTPGDASVLIKKQPRSPRRPSMMSPTAVRMSPTDQAVRLDPMP